MKSYRYETNEVVTEEFGRIDSILKRAGFYKADDIQISTRIDNAPQNTNIAKMFIKKPISPIEVQPVIHVRIAANFPKNGQASTTIVFIEPEITSKVLIGILLAMTTIYLAFAILKTRSVRATARANIHRDANVSRTKKALTTLAVSIITLLIYLALGLVAGILNSL